MISPIDSLANSEYMLYQGASGVNPNCPSYLNGYMANNTAWNYQTPFGYNNQSIWNNQNLWNNQFAQQSAQSSAGAVDTFAQQTPQAQQQTTFGASQQDLDTLGKYYLKGLNPSESLLGVAGGGAAFAVMNNPRMIVHPWNSLKATKAVDEMFKGIKQDGFLKELWNGTAKDAAGKEIKGGYEVLSEAYSRMHKLEALNNSKLGIFRKSIKGVKGNDGKLIYDSLKKEMTDALAKGDVKKIAEVTEKIKRATNAFTGHVPNLLRKMGMQKSMTNLRKFINSSQYEDLGKTVTGSLAKAGEKTTLKEFLKEGVQSQKGWGGIIFGAMEFVSDFDNLKNAFSKDTTTGMKQVGQTSAKAAGSIIGWTVGEAVGAWAGAKIGAAVGTAFCPGLGTAIGAVAGLVGGTVGCHYLSKFAKWIVGEDVGAKVKVDKMKRTSQGQQQLLQLTLPQAQEDQKNKKLDPKVAQALNNVYQSYANQQQVSYVG